MVGGWVRARGEREIFALARGVACSPAVGAHGGACRAQSESPPSLGSARAPSASYLAAAAFRASVAPWMAAWTSSSSIMTAARCSALSSNASARCCAASTRRSCAWTRSASGPAPPACAVRSVCERTTSKAVSCATSTARVCGHGDARVESARRLGRPPQHHHNLLRRRAGGQERARKVGPETVLRKTARAFGRRHAGQ
eukprot:6202728-Pleurochrysis_carterae.AAC.1